MYKELTDTIKDILKLDIPKERKQLLQPLIEYIKKVIATKEKISLNFICTHNSRRSHLSQIWMQVAASYYRIDNLYTYSGGTEATAIFSAVKTTLSNQGLMFSTVSEGINPVFGIRYSEDMPPIIAFSKTYDHPFNPSKSYAAIMTCNHADQNCPLILGADARIPVTYVDPKESDGSERQTQVYRERSEQIGSEMFYVIRTVIASN